MHLIVILAAMALVGVSPFMSGSPNDDAAYLGEQQADPNETPVDDSSTEHETRPSPD